MFAGDALAPRGHALAVQLHQQDAALGGAAEAGLEEVDQRHADLTQRDGFNFHKRSILLGDVSVTGGDFNGRSGHGIQGIQEGHAVAR